jgi:hypothetical protein
MYGDVYCNCPLSGETFWYDWASYEDFCLRYGNFDKGRFYWVSA